MKKVEEILGQTDKMYELLMEAYEIAGGLRDTFSCVEVNEGLLKSFCNSIRGKIYAIREMKEPFKQAINTLK